MSTAEAPAPATAFPAPGTGSAPEGCARSREDHERAIVVAVQYIQANYRRHITVSEMAHAAAYSRYHFTRIFRTLTTMTPGQFLTATRIAEAKRLLAGTDRTVARICTSVGYQSLGTFTTRFTELVGLSPGRFRQAAREHAGAARAGARAGGHGGDLVGTCRPPDGEPLVTFVGAYTAPLPLGVPEAWTTAGPDGRFRLPAPGPGRFHLLAAAPLARLTGAARLGAGGDLLVGHVPVEAGDPGEMDVTIDLRPRRPEDPPFLTAVPPAESLVAV